MRWLFTPAAVLFLFVAAWRNRHLFASLLEQALWPPLLLAIALWALLHLVSPIFTWLVLRETGTALPYRTALRIHVSRLPARYLPGGVWHTVSRVVDLHQLGIGKAQLTTMVVLENTVPVAAALTLGGICMPHAEGRAALAAAAAASGLALLALPPVLMRLRLWKDWPRLRPRHYAAAVGVSMAFWAVAGAAFASYWSAFPGTRADLPFIEIYASYLLGWAAGFLSVFAPQGIGVFEAVVGSLLRGTLPFAGVAVLAAGFRAASVAADLLAWSVLHIVCRTARAMRD